MAITGDTERRGRSRANHGATKIRPAADGTVVWLDEVAESLTAATRSLNEVMAQNPATRADCMPVMEQLLHVSMRIVTMRHEAVSGQPAPSGDETRLASLDNDIASTRANNPTNDDLHRALQGMTWKIAGVAVLLAGAVFCIAKYIR